MSQRVKYELYSSENFIDSNLKSEIYEYISCRDNILIVGRPNTGKSQLVLTLLYEYFNGNIEKYITVNTKEDLKRIQYSV